MDVRITGDAVDASASQLLFQREGPFTTWDVLPNGWDACGYWPKRALSNRAICWKL